MKALKLICVSFCLVYCFQIQSQSIFLDIGFNFSNIADSELNVETLVQRGPALGIGFKNDITSRLGYSIETQYSVKGYKLKGAINEFYGFLPEGFTNFNYHYIDILPLAQVSVYKGITVLLGGNVGFNMGETYNGEKAEIPSHNKVDLGLAAGLQYYLRNYNFRLLFNQGLIDPTDNTLQPDVYGNPIGEVSYKNLNIQATVGFNLIEFENKILPVQ